MVAASHQTTIGLTCTKELAYYVRRSDKKIIIAENVTARDPWLALTCHTGVLIALTMVPFGLVVYMGEGELSVPCEDGFCPPWSVDLSRRQCLQRRYDAVISSSAECGAGIMLNGTGSGDPCRMYSMYSFERTNFHSMSWSVYNACIQPFTYLLTYVYRVSRWRSGRASNFWPSGHGFDSRFGRYQAPRSTQPSIPPG